MPHTVHPIGKRMLESNDCISLSDLTNETCQVNHRPVALYSYEDKASFKWIDSSTETVEKFLDTWKLRNCTMPLTRMWNAAHIVPVSIVVGMTNKRGIGNKGSLPWPHKTYPNDMKFFKTITSEACSSRMNCIIMGRLTWESLNKRCLPNRVNIVVSSTLSQTTSISCSIHELPTPVVVSSLSSAFRLVRSGALNQFVDQAFVIGGSKVYEEALKSDCVSRLYITRISQDYECDVFFPNECEGFKTVGVSKSLKGSDGSTYDFMVQDKKLTATQLDLLKQVWQPPNHSSNIFAPFFGSPEKAIANSPFKTHEEYQYLDLIERILEKGIPQADRTGVGTLAIFGHQFRFDLSNSFPLLTTKRVFWRGLVEELLWFLRGDTNSSHLSSLNVKIWDSNGSREFLDQRGLQHREVGDLGPVYGFQWRHFGANYVDMHHDYTGQGIDQLAQCIEKLKRDPADRRIILTAWNPADLEKMALPPCHMFCQFFCANNKLSCQLYQRSCDIGLGVPFNIASYALLTLLIAQVCDLEPGEFIHTLGNAHIYNNHVEALKEQIKRTPQPFPQVEINPLIKDIEAFKASDITLKGYFPLSKIPMEMAV